MKPKKGILLAIGALAAAVLLLHPGSSDTPPDATGYQAACPSVSVEEEAAEAGTVAEEPIMVYVTYTGEKYHSAGCRYLARSCVPMRLDQAKREYGPCSRCGPPR